MTHIIAIVGKSGSGKSTFSNLLSKKLNCEILYIDKIGHSIYDDQRFIDFVNDRLGSKYLNDQGKISDRKKIGNYIFSHKGSPIVEEFNTLTWSLMEKIIDEKLAQCGKYVIMDWFNLPNTKYFAQADYKILTKAKDEEKRILMVRLRDNISKEYLEKRENNGISYNECDYDFVIENDYDTIDIIDKAEIIGNIILKKLP